MKGQRNRGSERCSSRSRISLDIFLLHACLKLLRRVLRGLVAAHPSPHPVSIVTSVEQCDFCDQSNGIYCGTKNVLKIRKQFIK